MKTLIGIFGLITALIILPSAFADLPYEQEVKQTINIQIGNDNYVIVFTEYAVGRKTIRLQPVSVV